jgi:hypothetical protein
VQALPEARLSKNRSAKPHSNWLPLRQAVFRFGMTEDDEAAAIHDKPLLCPSEFKEIAESSALLHQTTIDIEESANPPFSMHQLTKKLLEISGAHKVEIDPITSTFSFVFSHTPFVAFGGTPWGILAEPQGTVANSDPRLDADALFDKEGFVSISHEKSSILEKHDQSVRKATGLVFRQFLISAFDRAVSTEAVALYAQVETLSAPFVRVAAHVWPVLTIIDWQNGMAVDPDGTKYRSIYAARQSLAAPGLTKRHTGLDIDAFVNKYITDEKAAERRPTLSGCEKAAKAAGIRGYRQRLRNTFKATQNSAGVEVKRGRHSKSPK